MMKTGKSIFGAFLVLAGLLGLGGVWYLHQEESVPTVVGLAPLSLDGGATAAEWRPPVAAEPEARVPVEEASPDEPFRWPEGTLEGELVFRFGTASELQKFLREARRAGLMVDGLSALQMVRVRTGNDEQLRRALYLGKNAEAGFNPRVASPDIPPLDGAADGFRPFGDQALPWMGVPDNNQDWGKGVRIAVLDTGVGDHPSLADASITHLSMLEGGDGAGDYGSHGMAVASLLVGQGEIRGIVPGAELMSIQVLNAAGEGNGFDLARGIIAAVDGGANIINLSLGTPTESQALWEAVMYAHARDIVVVASAGNDGGGRLLFPAGFAGVVSVGSVDADGQHLPFSNRGESLALSAPGFSLATAGPEGSTIYSNGTSFSGPLVAGALASLLPQMGVWEAVDLLQRYTTDAGPPGPDGYYGHGLIDMERVLWRNTPGIYDIAVADHYLDVGGNLPEMLVTVQNRGTEAVGNISLEVVVNGDVQHLPIGSLSAGGVATGTVFLGEALRLADSVDVLSRVVVLGVEDVRPDNDRKGSTLSLGPAVE